MAVFLRELGIPARFVQGFLPGTPEGGGLRTVRNLDSHAWVQAYFPGYGWIDFDPTGGSVAQLAPLPSGRPEATASARPSGSAGTATRRPDGRDPNDDLGSGATGSAGTGDPGRTGALVGIALILLVGIGALAGVAWQRGPRGPVSAESAYGSVARLADTARLCAATRADGLRIRRRAGRGAPDRPARARDRGARQGRGRLWRTRARR